MVLFQIESDKIPVTSGKDAIIERSKGLLLLPVIRQPQ